MAVTSIKERHQQRRSGIDKDGKLTHTRVFLVICDNGHDGTAVAIVAQLGLVKVPRYHEAHPKLDGTYVSDVSAEPLNDDDRRFLVTVEYSQPDNQFSQPNQNPIDALAVISYGAADATETYFYDWSPAPADWNPIKDGTWKGKPLATSAGDAFEDAREREAAELIITVATNEPSYNPLLANAFSHTINEQTMEIDGVVYPAHSLKLSPITAEKVVQKEESGVSSIYYKVTKIVKYKPEGWNDDIFDAGFNELDYATAQPPPRTMQCNLVPIINGGGVRLDKPWPLNGKGKKKKNPTDAPAVLTFRPYKWVAWSDLRWS